MKLLFRIIGTIFIIIACFWMILGFISWPPGGLMFALPYIFFVLALGFGVVGVLLFLVGRKPKGNLLKSSQTGEKFNGDG
jgi:hypothetical protein